MRLILDIATKQKTHSLAFAISLMLLGAFATLSIKVADKLIESRVLVEQTYAVLDEISTLSFQIEQIETARRAYVSTGKVHFLQPFEVSNHEIPVTVADLNALVVDPRQQFKLKSLVPLITELQSKISTNIELRKSRIFTDEENRSFMDENKLVLDRCRYTLQEMRARQLELLEIRRAASNQELLLLKVVMAGSIMGAVLLFLYVFRRYAYEAIERQKIADGLVESKKQIEESVSQLEIQGQMSRMLQSCQQYPDFFEIVKLYAEKLLGNRGALFLMRESKNILEEKTNWGTSHASEDIFSPNDCWALRQGANHSSVGATGLICHHSHHSPTEASLCIPIIAQGVILGTIYIEADSADEVEGQRQSLASSFASQVALALANLNLRNTLANLSVRDPLTGLFNRRYMEESMTREIAIAERKKTNFAVIMFDIDHFKRFNDTFGHDAGDYLLKEVGSLFMQFARGGDVACRYGGEEFVLICHDVVPEAVEVRINALREQISNLDLQHYGRSLGRVTASFGIALFPDHGESGEKLLLAADKALYRAKEAGRNRVEMASLDMKRSEAGPDHS